MSILNLKTCAMLALLCAECSCQSNLGMESVLSRLRDPEARAFAVQDLDQRGKQAVRELIAIARRNERAEDLPGILWALKELAHHGGGYFEDLRELRQRCAGATLGSLIDVQVAVLPFLESDLVQQMSGVLSEEALELMTQTDDQEMRKRLWLACHHAQALRGNRTRPTIGIDTETHFLIREL
jgi:hypothetical protein